jgi:hypothetical protein
MPSRPSRPSPGVPPRTLGGPARQTRTSATRRGGVATQSRALTAARARRGLEKGIARRQRCQNRDRRRTPKRACARRSSREGARPRRSRSRTLREASPQRAERSGYGGDAWVPADAGAPASERPPPPPPPGRLRLPGGAQSARRSHGLRKRAYHRVRQHVWRVVPILSLRRFSTNARRVPAALTPVVSRG